MKKTVLNRQMELSVGFSIRLNELFDNILNAIEEGGITKRNHQKFVFLPEEKKKMFEFFRSIPLPESEKEIVDLSESQKRIPYIDSFEIMRLLNQHR